MLYYPEMGEKPANRLFATSYVRSCYSLTWPASRNEEARATIRSLRIRPMSCKQIEPRNLGEWSPLRIWNENGFTCLISMDAHRKLMERDLCANEMLLD